MRFNRKIIPDTKPKQTFVTKKRLREDEIDFAKLRSYRLDRVKKELENMQRDDYECINRPGAFVIHKPISDKGKSGK